MEKKEKNKRYYFVEVKQMQYFEVEVDEKNAPLTEEIFFNEYYSLDNCDLDTTIKEIREVSSWTL